jgi:hypothetical protein
MADEKPKTLLSEIKEIDVSASKPSASESKRITPLRCFLSAIVAGAIALFFYNSAGVIAGIFAQTRVESDNFIVLRMSSAVRTLVIGLFALGAGVFGMAAVGLTGLGLQTLFKNAPEQPSDS